MSKEQTPINIQSELTSLYGKYGWSEMFLYKAQLLFDSESEKNAKAKVLEALEREVTRALEKLRDELHEEEAKKVEHSLTALLRMNEDLLNQLKNTVTLEQLEEEVVKAYEKGIENALTHDSYIGQVIGIDYYKKQVKPKYE